MPERLCPQPANDRARGYPLALWLFAAITLASLVRSCIAIFPGDGAPGSWLLLVVGVVGLVLSLGCREEAAESVAE